MLAVAATRQARAAADPPPRVRIAYFPNVTDAAKGEALRVIAGASSAGAQFIVRPDSGIEKPADLAGLVRCGTILRRLSLIPGAARAHATFIQATRPSPR